MVAHGVVADIQGHVLKLAWKARLDEHRLSLVSYAETTQLVSVSPSISGSCDLAAVIRREWKQGESGEGAILRLKPARGEASHIWVIPCSFNQSFLSEDWNGPSHKCGMINCASRLISYLTREGQRERVTRNR